MMIGRWLSKTNPNNPNLVPRASFPLTSGRKTRALGATISGMRHSIRLFSIVISKRMIPELSFSTAGQGERGSGNETETIPETNAERRYLVSQCLLSGQKMTKLLNRNYIIRSTAFEVNMH